MFEPIKPVRVLHGHVDEESAYLVDDYPYGRRLRCEIRYWVDTAVKGAAKGQQRFMAQTTNPKAAGRVWNKPKASTYSSMVVPFLNEDDHVKHWSVDSYHMTPQGDALFRLHGLLVQLTGEQRERYDRWVRLESQRYAEPWREWTETVFQIAGHIRDHGTVPKVEGNVWVSPDGRRYLGDERLQAAYFTSAQNLINAG